ncbi:hypothetical protein KEJ15_09365 [Candidatus Bathyarchaeota archaeon]|nr:hypothetical protein [Candidatus Bathyarchaeota archaeon]
MKCKLCDKETQNKDFCDFHNKAYDNIVEKYTSWKKALSISWKEYLSKVAENPLTGEWAKQVAEHLINSGEKHHV